MNLQFRADRGERRRLWLLLSWPQVPESDHGWDSVGDATDVQGVMTVELTTVEDPIILKGRLQGSCEVVAEFGRSEFDVMVSESTAFHAIGSS